MSKNKKPKGPLKTALGAIFKVFLIIFIIGFFAIVGAGTGIIISIVNDADQLDMTNLSLDFTSFVYYIDPNTKQEVKLEELYGDQNRIWVSIDKMPKNLKNATIAIEDERFMSHKGVDIKRTTSATLNYLVKKDASYGGSTITQQLIKNVTGENDGSPKRKVQEMWRAINLERQLSKDEILELYLNTIFLSNGCNGVQAAANKFFGKDVSELSLAQCAAIIGITQYPTRYDPIKNPEANKEKQELVLSKMKELGFISQYDYIKAVEEELEFSNNDIEQQSNLQSYFVDQVINDVLYDLEVKKGYQPAIASKLLFTGGLKIYCTLNPNIQEALDEVFQNEQNFPNTTDKPQAAMLILDPYNGEIKGIVGGRGKKQGDRVLNRATQSFRQPGSAIKPIAVYAPGIEYDIFTPITVFDDSYISINNWAPKNSNNRYMGLMNVYKALEVSNNVVAVKALDKLGIDTSFRFMKENLGVTSLVESSRRADGKVYSDKFHNTLALGGLTDGMSVKELANAYAPFVNKGMYVKSYTYTKVLDSRGKVVLENIADPEIAMSEQTAFLMTNMLQNVATNGTGSAAKFSNTIDIAGKTGTTTENKDRLFVGYTPYYVAATWFGYDDPKQINISGNNPALVLWKKVMEKVHENLGEKHFQVPSGMVKASVCIDSGELASGLCSKDPRGSRVSTFYVKEGTGPVKTCSVHVSVKIDTGTGLVATDSCPLSSIEDRVFISRPVKYTGTAPADAGYQVPGKCTHDGSEISNEPTDLIIDSIEEPNEPMEDEVANETHPPSSSSTNSAIIDNPSSVLANDMPAPTADTESSRPSRLKPLESLLP